MTKEVPSNCSQVHESYFIELMLDKVQICGENRQTGTFSKHNWTDIRKKCYMKFRLKYSLKAFENKFAKNGILFFYTVDASNEWWDEQVKEFHVSGCPEYGKLAMIYGDTVATGNLRETQDGGFTADGMEENVDNHFSSLFRTPSGTHRSTYVSNDSGGTVVGEMKENIDNQFHRRSRTPTGNSRRAENAKAKLEDKTKYPVYKCLKLLGSMGKQVGMTTYVQAVISRLF
ncbi:hypothetical protein MKX01_012123 [Papaver californicum]|nr:hypothetical protein MKX01_012123 [Papaver californicum]